MLLAVDIGNTNINLALIDRKGRIKNKFKIPTHKFNLRTTLKGIRRKIDKIIVVSVVPKVLKKVKREVRTLIVGDNIKVPLKSVYNKKEIGQDRLVTAFAAKSLYDLPILIIDFGTAVTFDVVSKKGAYLGGLILPGIKMSLTSLSERTAMLPETYLKKTRSIIGKDTRSSIRGGMIYGYAAMCEGLIGLFRKKLGRDLKVVATGGDAPIISRYTSSIRKVDLNLSLKGLYLLSKKKA